MSNYTPAVPPPWRGRTFIMRPTWRKWLREHDMLVLSAALILLGAVVVWHLLWRVLP